MWVARIEAGYLFGDLDDVVVSTLKGVPMLLESEDERVRRRLLPETCEREEDEEQWRRHAVPELERLFVSRAQLVRRDLGTLQPMGTDGRATLVVPYAHCAAWLAALNAARLALFELSELRAEHLTPDGFDLLTGKQREAVLRIDLLASFQAVLLGDFDVAADDEGAVDLA